MMLVIAGNPIFIFFAWSKYIFVYFLPSNKHIQPIGSFMTLDTFIIYISVYIEKGFRSTRLILFILHGKFTHLNIITCRTENMCYW